MNTSLKGILLVVGAYAVTLGVTAFIVTFAVVILTTGSHSCSDMSRALLMLWAVVAVLFLASVVVVGMVARKLMIGGAGRLAVMAAHGMALLASYIVIAFVLMVLFNC